MRSRSRDISTGALVLFLAGSILLGCGKDKDHDRRAAPVPEVVLVYPDDGVIAGGDGVVIDTKGFRDDFGLDTPEVFFGAVPSSGVTPLSPDLLWAVTPGSASIGPVDVEVRSTGFAQPAVLIDGFIYTDSSLIVVDIFGKSILAPDNQVIYTLNRAGMMAGAFGSFIDRFGNLVTGTLWEFSLDRVIQSIQGLPVSARFNVTSFACNRDKFRPVSVPASDSNKLAAETWLAGHFPWGGPGIGPGVADALRERDNRTVIVATGGLIDCGATGYFGDLNTILSANSQNAAIHTFGFDDTGLGAQFLQDIAAQTGGTYTHFP